MFYKSQFDELEGKIDNALKQISEVRVDFLTLRAYALEAFTEISKALREVADLLEEGKTEKAKVQLEGVQEFINGDIIGDTFNIKNPEEAESNFYWNAGADGTAEA